MCYIDSGGTLHGQEHSTWPRALPTSTMLTLPRNDLYVYSLIPLHLAGCFGWVELLFTNVYKEAKLLYLSYCHVGMYGIVLKWLPVALYHEVTLVILLVATVWWFKAINSKLEWVAPKGLHQGNIPPPHWELNIQYLDCKSCFYWQLEERKCNGK